MIFQRPPNGVITAFAAMLAIPAFLLVFYVSFYPTRFSSFDFRTTRLVVEFFDRKEDPAILVIGDSTAAFGIDATTLRDARSLPLLNGSTVEAYYALRRWIEGGRKPTCLISSFSFHWPNYKTYFWNLFVRSGYYNRNDFHEIASLGLLARNFPAVASSGAGLEVKYWFYRAGFGGLTLAGIQDSIFQSNAAVYRFVREIDKNKGSVLLDRKYPPPPIPENSLAKGETSDLFRIYFKKFVDLAAANDIRLFMVNLPRTEEMEAVIPQSAKKLRAELMDYNLKYDQNENVDVPHNFTDADFYISNHLLAKGAKEVASYLETSTRFCHAPD